jgi:hypothetical protein
MVTADTVAFPTETFPETIMFDALTAFEPRTEPYRDVPEIVEALTVLAPFIGPYTPEEDTVFEPEI